MKSYIPIKEGKGPRSNALISRLIETITRIGDDFVDWYGEDTADFLSDDMAKWIGEAVDDIFENDPRAGNEFLKDLKSKL